MVKIKISHIILGIIVLCFTLATVSAYNAQAGGSKPKNYTLTIKNSSTTKIHMTYGYFQDNCNPSYQSITMGQAISKG